MRANRPPQGQRRAPRLPAAERREQLLRSALTVVGERGYHGLTMEAIAREAGVTKPVVYDWFPNRDEVMIALLAAEEERAVAEMLAAIGDAGAGAESLAEVLIGSIRRVLDVIGSRPESYRLILLHTEGTPALVRERIDAGRRTIVQRVEEILDLGLAPELDVDTELLALAVVALGEHAASLLLTDPERFGPERFESGLRQALRALLPSPGVQAGPRACEDAVRCATVGPPSGGSSPG